MLLVHELFVISQTTFTRSLNALSSLKSSKFVKRKISTIDLSQKAKITPLYHESITYPPNLKFMFFLSKFKKLVLFNFAEIMNPFQFSLTHCLIASLHPLAITIFSESSNLF
jgi:hypothetical protein